MQAADVESGEAATAAKTAAEGPGGRIREIRTVRRITLRQLSELVGISIGQLSQIERNQAKLTVATLKSISDALGVQISWLFDDGHVRIDKERRVIVRAGQRQTLKYSQTGVTDELLVPDLSGPLEMLMSHFAPGSDTDFYRHVGVEAGLVVEGELELTVGEDVFHLKEGDSFTFRSTESHRGRNTGNRPARVVWVITPPAF